MFSLKRTTGYLKINFRAKGKEIDEIGTGNCGCYCKYL
jgi:hypothetical protein